MASIPPPYSYGARKVGTPISGNVKTAEGNAAKMHRSFGGRPVHQPRKTTPLLWLIKGLFSPLSKEEEIGESESKGIETVTPMKIVEHKMSSMGEERKITARKVDLGNVEWNRTVFNFIRTLSLSDFDSESFNLLLGEASSLLCRLPGHGNHLSASLSKALIHEVLQLPFQDREKVLTNLIAFKADLLQTARETGPLYETSSDGLIPNGQFAVLIDQMLSQIFTIVESSQETKD